MLFVAISFVTICTNSFAGEVYDAKVVGVTVNSTYIYIKVQDATVQVAQPSCATGFYQWAISSSSNAANMFLSVALTAKTSGQKVRIVGKSSCAVDSNKEDVDFMMLVDGPM